MLNKAEEKNSISFISFINKNAPHLCGALIN